MLESSGILETYSFFGQIEAFFKQKPQGILWKTQGFAKVESAIAEENVKKSQFFTKSKASEVGQVSPPIKRKKFKTIFIFLPFISSEVCLVGGGGGRRDIRNWLRMSVTCALLCATKTS